MTATPEVPEAPPETATLTAMARAWHEATWRAIGYPEPPIPWEAVHPDDVAAQLAGAEAALGASGLREKLAAVTRECERLRELLSEAAIADPDDGEDGYPSLVDAATLDSDFRDDL